MSIEAKLLKLIGVLFLLVPACSPPHAGIEDEAPSPPDAAHGRLQVYTPTEELSSEGPVYFEGYRICSSKGQPFKDVYWNGSVDLSNQEPRTVSVPAGKYFVEVWGENCSWDTLPIVVERGRLTVVDLRHHRTNSL